MPESRRVIKQDVHASVFVKNRTKSYQYIRFLYEHVRFIIHKRAYLPIAKTKNRNRFLQMYIPALYALATVVNPFDVFLLDC